MAEDKATAESTEDQGQKESTPGGESTPLMYPLNLREHEGREVMRFSMRDRQNPNMDSNKSIYLYTPKNVQVSDGGSYENIDLGMMGAVYGKAQDSMAKGAGFIDSIKSIGIGDVYQGLKNTMASKTGMGAGGMMKTGQAVNPFRNTTFAGNEMRSFAFQFPMIAQSKKEADEIRKIENVFRKFVYAEYAKSELALKYPPYWVIQFMTGEGTENPYMPFINLCYLEKVSVTYNSSSSVFHEGGAPIELQLEIGFRETKMMTRGDLYKDLNDWSPDYTYTRGAHSDLSEKEAIAAVNATKDEVVDEVTGP